ncbi:MAG: hypothetical protein JOS17DRAFT_415003 [Linnemannia elongata]|nr:MAG: hypothetical protein JOS17DRAFT_415003 [Linnemannia elongata]
MRRKIINKLRRARCCLKNDALCACAGRQREEISVIFLCSSRKESIANEGEGGEGRERDFGMTKSGQWLSSVTPRVFLDRRCLFYGRYWVAVMLWSMILFNGYIKGTNLAQSTPPSTTSTTETNKTRTKKSLRSQYFNTPHSSKQQQPSQKTKHVPHRHLRCPHSPCLCHPPSRCCHSPVLCCCRRVLFRPRCLALDQETCHCFGSRVCRWCRRHLRLLHP